MSRGYADPTHVVGDVRLGEGQNAEIGIQDQVGSDSAFNLDMLRSFCPACVSSFMGWSVAVARKRQHPRGRFLHWHLETRVFSEVHRPLWPNS